MRSSRYPSTTECPSMSEEAAESCYMALLSEKRAPEAVARIFPGAMEFLVHIETCESCRDVFEKVRTFIDAVRALAKGRRGIALVKHPRLAHTITATKLDVIDALQFTGDPDSNRRPST
jgi:hypothetical protein